MALGVKYPADSGTSPNTALHAFLPGRDKEGLGELTADHVDVRRQATIDLGRGQAHLGGAKEGPRSKADSKSCYHSHMYYGLNGVLPAQIHVEILTPSTSEHDCIRDIVLKEIINH